MSSLTDTNIPTAAVDIIHRPVRASVASTPSLLADLYELTKPRLNFLVLVTTAVGYFMAATVPADYKRFLQALLGTALAAASAAVLNQVIEREPDKLMPRTRNRPLPAGRISAGWATLYGVLLGVAGVVDLAVFVNSLTALLGLITIVSYLFLYTPMKQISPMNTLVGALTGALPPMMGWTAVRDTISPEAIALFAILFAWQIPHFLAIAIMYKKDYAAGGFRMLPVVDESQRVTGRHILLWGAALIPISLMPTLLGMSGAIYFVAALVLGFVFLYYGFVAASSRLRVDARRLFFCSILYLPLLLAVMMLNKQ